MIRKILSAAALAACAATPAFALTDPGFEAANNWITPIGGLTRVQYGTPGATVAVRDDAYDMQPDGYGGLVANVVVGATPTVDLPGSIGVGGSFGLIETCAASTKVGSCSGASSSYSFNLGGPASAAGDYFLVRLMTADYEPEFNDKVTVTYYGLAGTLGTDHVSVFTENPADPYWVETQGYWDSGWAAFGVPVGTNAISVLLENRADMTDPGYLPGYELYNRPVVAIDYAPAVSPVPEADVTAMMLAGLGVLGMVARRRKAK
jgi:PEP-CTERM motif